MAAASAAPAGGAHLQTSSSDNSLRYYWGRPVEARKSEAGTTWYQALLVGDSGKDGKKVRIRFPRQTFPIVSSSAEDAHRGYCKSVDDLLADHPSDDGLMGVMNLRTSAYDVSFSTAGPMKPPGSGTGKGAEAAGSATLCTYDVENCLWQEKTVFVKGCVRERNAFPQNHTARSWEPVVGELVELGFEADQFYPAGWALGRVTGRRGEFFFVQLEADESAAFTKDRQTMIVKTDTLRRVVDRPEPPVDGDDGRAPFVLEEFLKNMSPGRLRFPNTFLCPGSDRLVKKSVMLADPEDLHTEWLFTPDAADIFSQLRQKLDLVLIVPSPETVSSARTLEDASATTFAEVFLYAGGDDELSKQNLAQAELLLQIHWHHQSRIQQFTRERETRIAELTELKEKIETGQSLSRVFSDQRVIGKLIGKAGKNINKLQNDFGVEIKVTKTAKTAKVTVFGSDAESVKAAFEETDLAIVEMEMTEEECRFLRTKCQLMDIQKDTGVQSIGFGPPARHDRPVLEIFGKTLEVEEAKLVVEGHMSYYETYKTMNEERETLRTEEQKFRDEFGVQGGPGKGSRGKKGKSKRTRGAGSEPTSPKTEKGDDADGSSGGEGDADNGAGGGKQNKRRSRKGAGKKNKDQDGGAGGGQGKKSTPAGAGGAGDGIAPQKQNGGKESSSEKANAKAKNNGTSTSAAATGKSAAAGASKPQNGTTASNGGGKTKTRQQANPNEPKDASNSPEPSRKAAVANAAEGTPVETVS